MFRKADAFDTDVGEMGDDESFSLKMDCRIDCDWKCVIDVLRDRKSKGACVALAPSSDDTAFVC